MNITKIPFHDTARWGAFTAWCVKNGIGPRGSQFDDVSYWAWIKGLENAGYVKPRYLLWREGEIVGVLVEDDVKFMYHRESIMDEIALIHKQTDALSAAKVAIEDVSPSHSFQTPSPFDPTTEYAEHMLLAACAHILSRKMVQLADRRRHLELENKRK